MFKVNNKDTRTTPMAFEKVNPDWEASVFRFVQAVFVSAQRLSLFFNL